MTFKKKNFVSNFFFSWYLEIYIYNTFAITGSDIEFRNILNFEKDAASCPPIQLLLFQGALGRDDNSCSFIGWEIVFLKCFLIAVMIWYNNNIITIFAATVATGSRGIFYLEECYQKTPHNFMCFLSNLRTFCVISFTAISVNLGPYRENLRTYCVRYCTNIEINSKKVFIGLILISIHLRTFVAD